MPRRRFSIRNTTPAAASPSATKNEWVPSGGAHGMMSCSVGNTGHAQSCSQNMTQNGIATAASTAITDR